MTIWEVQWEVSSYHITPVTPTPRLAPNSTEACAMSPAPCHPKLPCSMIWRRSVRSKPRHYQWRSLQDSGVLENVHLATSAMCWLWGNWPGGIPADVLAPEVAKMLPGSISPKGLKPEMRQHRQGTKFPLGPQLARFWEFGGKFDPCRCFRLSGSRNLGDI